LKLDVALFSFRSPLGIVVRWPQDVPEYHCNPRKSL
jgi:hypothetical protein